MDTNKPAPTDHEVHGLIRGRWSPRAFSSKTVSEDELRSLLEAARWAVSRRQSKNVLDFPTACCRARYENNTTPSLFTDDPA